MVSSSICKSTASTVMLLAIMPGAVIAFLAVSSATANFTGVATMDNESYPSQQSITVDMVPLKQQYRPTTAQSMPETETTSEQPELFTHDEAMEVTVNPDSVTSAAGTIIAATFGLMATIAAGLAGYIALFTASHMGAVKSGLSVTVEYWRTLAYYWNGGSYSECPHFKDSNDARVHLRSLALINEMWDQPHYRNGTFGVDMAKNLRNVAVPGTGLPLSALCFSSTVFRLVLLLVYPLTALAAAIIRRKPDATADDVAGAFENHLVRPTDWFSLWRLNCRLASYHALKTKDDGFRAEDKWTFITESLKNNVPVSPIMEIPNIVCKDRNEEGGMGIAFYKNALSGGDWIIQNVMHNSDFLKTMLPDNAPLSTIRIVTGSSMSFAEQGAANPIKAFSAVFRAGRAGASTDHDAILFDVDLKTGLIKDGSINKEWYKLGTQNVNPYGRPDVSVFTSHPDCGKKVTGITIPDMAALEAICTDAHMKSCPNVPLCGWDVALTTEGVCLLEVNLSCNFFQATVDYPEYFKFVDQQFKYLEGVDSKAVAAACSAAPKVEQVTAEHVTQHRLPEHPAAMHTAPGLSAPAPAPAPAPVVTDAALAPVAVAAPAPVAFKVNVKPQAGSGLAGLGITLPAGTTFKNGGTINEFAVSAAKMQCL